MTSKIPGCICIDRTKPDLSVYTIKDDCPYHNLAAQNPDDHSIPWNCPTYWDGCNCADPEYFGETNVTRDDPQKVVEEFEEKYGVKSENLVSAFLDDTGTLDETHEDFWVWTHNWSLVKIMKRHEGNGSHDVK